MVVPTASTRSAGRIRSQAASGHLVALAVKPVLPELLDGDRPERVEPHVQRDPLDVELGEQLRREVEPCRRSGGRARLARVDRLVPLGIGERLGDVRGQRGLTGRLAVEPDTPAALAEMLDQLDRPVAAAGPKASRRPREGLPQAVTERLEEQHLSARPLDRDPRGHDTGVVDDDERPAGLREQVGEPPVPDRAARAVVHEQPRLVASRRRMLRDQLRRKVVVELR